MMKFLKTVAIAFAMTTFAQAQPEGEALPALMLSVNYAAQVPTGDLQQDFGSNFSFGIAADYRTRRAWVLGANLHYLFGGEVKNDVLAGLRTAEGQILGSNQEYAYVTLDMRGFYAGLRGGKVTKLLRANPQSGLRFTVGAGVFQHRIRIKDNTAEVPQLAGDYLKGYDRLTNGLALEEFVGYHFLSNNRLINFYIGLEALQAFTRNRRDWDTASMQRLDAPRFDALLGVRLGWVLPIYRELNPDAIFY